MRVRAAALAMVLVALAAVVAILVVLSRPQPAVDTVMLNDLRHRVETGWESLGPQVVAGFDGRVAVVDGAGRVRLQRGGAPTEELAAAEADAAVLPVVVRGERVGTVFHVDPARADAAAHRERLVAWIAVIAVAVVVAIGLGMLRWVRSRVLVPFTRMRAFAARVAGGDLDTPLHMDRANAFGAFTESFDIMRSELAASRGREEALRESKEALVAQLSHDIRTPVASISAVAELLAVDEPDAARADRLRTIVGKSRQIEDLVAELFRANRDEMEALPVEVSEHTSDDLAAQLAAADLTRRVSAAPPPPCLVRYDVRRIRRVLDNVLSNAQKYAGTEVAATWTLSAGELRLTIADRGPGVADHELLAVLGRGVRGSNVGDAPGQGLGLHTSAWLMERMGGSLAVRNTHPGFAVDLDVPLAGGADDTVRPRPGARLGDI